MVWSTYVNTRSSVVRSNKPKMLRGLSQNGMVVGTGTDFFPVVDTTPPAQRVDLTHPGISTEHGKPIGFPTRVELLQDRTTSLRVQDGGASECHAVMAWIGVLTPRASEQTSAMGLSSRERVTNRSRRQSR